MAPLDVQTVAPAHEGYRVELEVFEGPLDLLYHLVKEERIDIWDIPIAKLTEGYLAYLDTLRRLDVEPAAEFVVMAARLLYIKARMLLPAEQDEEAIDAGEEDPRLSLAADLYEYALYKEAAERMDELWFLRRDLYPRPESCRVKVNGAIYPDPAKGVSLADLALAFARVLEAQAKGRAVPVPQTKVSVAEKIDALRRLFTRRHRLTFDSLFRRRRSRPEMIATFLALLELVRQGVLMAQQEVSTGPIIIIRRENGNRS